MPTKHLTLDSTEILLIEDGFLALPRCHIIGCPIFFHVGDDLADGGVVTVELLGNFVVGHSILMELKNNRSFGWTELWYHQREWGIK